MNPIDFARSFVTRDWRHSSQHNNVRIQLDAACTIINNRFGKQDIYYLCAPCLGERYRKDDNLFAMPSYEWCGIFGENGKQSLIFRTHWISDRDDTTLDVERKDDIDIRTFPKFKKLTSHNEVVEIVVGTRYPLVARTELIDESRGLTAILEYPVRTMNAYMDAKEFQVDTGPLIVPDFAKEVDRTIELFDMAYVVYNVFDKAEFVLRKPVQIAQNDTEPIWATDYSDVKIMPSRNEIYCGIPD